MTQKICDPVSSVCNKCAAVLAGHLVLITIMTSNE